ncbi:hypothetical protein TRVL_03153 [Trypanosoma vivax]|nr:hypothetical protein TRVL_03153 [Trypanosoma vivax]
MCFTTINTQDGLVVRSCARQVRVTRRSPTLLCFFSCLGKLSCFTYSVPWMTSRHVTIQLLISYEALLSCSKNVLLLEREGLMVCPFTHALHDGKPAVVIIKNAASTTFSAHLLSSILRSTFVAQRHASNAPLTFGVFF